MLFFDDVLLSVTIPLLILVSGFFTARPRFGQDLAFQKLIFFLIFRFCELIVIFCCGYLLFLLWQFSYTSDVFYTMYNATDASFILGNFFFKKDLPAIGFQLILGLLVVLYLQVTRQYFLVTTINVKYCLEFPILVLTTFWGFKIFLMSYDLMVIFLSLEIISFCSIILIGLQITTTDSVIFPIEAAFKYFLFSALAGCFLLISFTGILTFLSDLNVNQYLNFIQFFPLDYYLNWETILMLQFLFFCGYFMKLGVSPFHQWVADVYEGADLLITSFLVLIISPGLNFKLFMFFQWFLPQMENHSLIVILFLICGLLSIFWGTLSAFLQVKIKRFLAFSAITHIGYILLGFGTGTLFGVFASLLYLVVYVVMNVVFFSSLILIKPYQLLSFIYISHLKPILRSHFLLIFLFITPLLSYAGFPPFAGFFSKMFILLSLVLNNYLVLTLFLLVYIVVNAYLYLRFIKIALFEKVNENAFYLPIFSLNKNLNQQLTVWLTAFYSLLMTYVFRANGLVFTLFFLSLFLILFIFFLPVTTIYLQQQVLLLNLFY